jgi:hypothetical protein
VTTRRARRRLVLADDGIIDPIAVKMAARGARTVALTRAERQLAVAASSPAVAPLTSSPSGCTWAEPAALTLAARCHGAAS